MERVRVMQDWFPNQINHYFTLDFDIPPHTRCLQPKRILSKMRV
jgi:hypothetical protein